MAGNSGIHKKYAWWWDSPCRPSVSDSNLFPTAHRMNTAALKTFAPAVRKQLMEAVTRKLDFALTAQTPDYLTTFARQVAALRKLAQADRAGIIERVAYTWFNRLAA